MQVIIKKNRGIIDFFTKPIIFIVCVFNMLVQLQSTILKDNKFSLCYWSIDKYNNILVLGGEKE